MRLVRHHLLELLLHLNKHPVLQDVATLVSIIDTSMPYTSTLMGFPGLLLLFKNERCGPNRAMQLLAPSSTAHFKKGMIMAARSLLEDSLRRWSNGTRETSQATRLLLRSHALDASFTLFYFAGGMAEDESLFDGWAWREQLLQLMSEAQACQIDT